LIFSAAITSTVTFIQEAAEIPDSMVDALGSINSQTQAECA
jgi:hypothetical protein